MRQSYVWIDRKIRAKFKLSNYSWAIKTIEYAFLSYRENQRSRVSDKNYEVIALFFKFFSFSYKQKQCFELCIIILINIKLQFYRHKMRSGSNLFNSKYLAYHFATIIYYKRHTEGKNVKINLTFYQPMKKLWKPKKISSSQDYADHPALPWDTPLSVPLSSFHPHLWSLKASS